MPVYCPILHIQDATAKARSQTRLAEVEKEIAALQDELRPLTMRYEAEKGRVDEQQRLQNKKAELQRKISVAKRDRDMAKVADLEYNALPEVLSRLEHVTKAIEEEKNKAGASQEGLVRQIVDETNIAEIVARWTGIPVSKLTSTERQKLLSLADVSGSSHAYI